MSGNSPVTQDQLTQLRLELSTKIENLTVAITALTVTIEERDRGRQEELQQTTNGHMIWNNVAMWVSALMVIINTAITWGKDLIHR